MGWTVLYTGLLNRLRDIKPPFGAFAACNEKSAVRHADPPSDPAVSHVGKASFPKYRTAGKSASGLHISDCRCRPDAGRSASGYVPLRFYEAVGRIGKIGSFGGCRIWMQITLLGTDRHALLPYGQYLQYEQICTHGLSISFASPPESVQSRARPISSAKESSRRSQHA